MTGEAGAAGPVEVAKEPVGSEGPEGPKRPKDPRGATEPTGVEAFATRAEQSGYRPSERRLAHEAYRRSRARRSALIATASTVLTAVALYLLVVNSPGWEVTRRTFFNLDYARQALPEVLRGCGSTWS